MLLAAAGAVLFLLVVFALPHLFEGKFAGRPKIALLTLEGTIFRSREVLEILDEYGRDDSIRAVVVRINSPGGGVGASQEIYSELLRLRARGKKVVSSLGAVAASGGYYIACASDKIFANPGTITGSIGVIIEVSNVEELLKKLGMRVDVIKSGAHKDLGSPVRPLTEADRKILQRLIDDSYEQFVRAVAKGRRMLPERVQELADGRIISGERAKAEGLVDELGNLKDAIRAAAEMSGIPGEPLVVERRPRVGLLWWLLRLAGQLRVLAERLEEPGLRLEYLWPNYRFS